MLVQQQKGFSLLEAMVALSLFLIFSLSVSKNVQMVMWSRGKVIRKSLAIQIANDRLEEFAAVNPSTLSDSDDGTDTVSRNGISFQRVTDVTVLTSGAREVSVSVSSNNLIYSAEADATAVYSLWGYQ